MPRGPIIGPEGLRAQARAAALVSRGEAARVEARADARAVEADEWADARAEMEARAEP